MTMRRDVVLGILLLGTFLGLWMLYEPPKPPASLAVHDSLVAERPHVDSVIAEHADSARERVKLVYVGQDAVKRSAAAATAAIARADSLAHVAETAAEWHAAYDSLHRGADSLGLALAKEQKATENALAASAFWQLASIAGDSARAVDRRDADRLAADLKRAVKRTPLDYVAVSCGYGFKGVDCIMGIRFPFGR